MPTTLIVLILHSCAYVCRHTMYCTFLPLSCDCLHCADRGHDGSVHPSGCFLKIHTGIARRLRVSTTILACNNIMMHSCGSKAQRINKLYMTEHLSVPLVYTKTTRVCVRTYVCRWYVPDYSLAQPFRYGQGLGCDFIQQGCLTWMTQRDQEGYVKPFGACNMPAVYRAGWPGQLHH